MKDSVIAVIDIGSNSIRLQVSKVFERTYKVAEDYKETVRIGDNVYRTGFFSSEAIETIVGVLSRIKTIMDANKVETYRAVATASFREASNAAETAALVKDVTGLDIEIISGVEEARLMYLAASAYFQLNEGNTLLIDMGGGSTEFSYSERGDLKFSESTPLGCSKLTYEFFKNDPVKSEEIRKFKKYLKSAIDGMLPPYGVDKIICSGGTLNNISLIYNKRNNLSDSSVKFTDSVFLKHFINEIEGKSVSERLRISGLEPARADMVLSAAMLIQAIVKKYRLEGFYTLSGGLRTGLTIDLMNRMGVELLFQGGGHVDIRYSRLIETGKKYCFEEGHALQVTMLSKKIFESLKGLLKLESSDWHILEAASILHDVGQYISYAKHHKHSYYLITNTELAGYSEKETELIASVARYHRRALPSLSHTHYLQLSAPNREKVSKLAAVLRAADGLDRSHGAVIKDVRAEARGDKIIFSVAADGDFAMERSGFDKKKDLLENITGKTAVLL